MQRKLVEIVTEHFSDVWPEDRCVAITQTEFADCWMSSDPKDALVPPSRHWIRGCRSVGEEWRSDTAYKSFRTDTQEVAIDYLGAIITREVFENFVKEKQEKIKMNQVKTFTDAEKQKIVDGWLGQAFGVSKAEYCRNVGVSPRTLGRWIEKYCEEALGEDVSSHIRGSYHNPFEKGDIVIVHRNQFNDYGYCNAKEAMVPDIFGIAVIEDVDYDYDFDVEDDCFPDVEIKDKEGETDICDICFLEYLPDYEYVGGKFVKKGVAEDIPVHYTGTSESVTLYRGEDSATIHKDSPNFVAIVEAIKNLDLQEAWKLANVKLTIEEFSQGSVKVVDGVVTVKGFEVVNGMAERLVQMLEDGEKGVSVFVKFFENLMNVQDKRVVEELYDFLKHNDISLNDDGSFTGYKAVTSEYKDKYSGKLDNSPGTVVEMPRTLVDDNKDRTCSSGLHVGSIEYVRNFARNGDRIVTVKVFPEDVVSVPTDYNGQKLRACRYTVVEDVTNKA